jgi:hypothetical protein
MEDFNNHQLEIYKDQITKINHLIDNWFNTNGQSELDIELLFDLKEKGLSMIRGLEKGNSIKKTFSTYRR